MRGKAIKISPEYTAFITENSANYSTPKLAKMAKELGYGDHGASMAWRFIHKNGLPFYRGHHLYSDEQHEFIAQNQHITRAQLLIDFNAKFGTTITANALNVFCATRKIACLNHPGKYQKGCNSKDGTGNQFFSMKGVALKQYEASIATQFKKGEPTLNSKPLGYERVDSKTGLIEVRIAKPKSKGGNYFRRKHIVIWEEFHQQPIPRGHAIVFLDGDTRNFAIENLCLMSKGAIAIRTKSLRYEDAPTELKPALNAMAKLIHKTNSLNKKE